MKLGKEAKIKLGEKDVIWAAQALVDCAATVKGRELYGGVYFCKKLGVWFGLDGLRLFATKLPIKQEENGKFIAKRFAEDLTCSPVPEEESSWKPDLESFIPKGQAAGEAILQLPGVIAAADDKNYSAQMTINFEKDGVFTYLGEIPQARLSDKHIHFNMAVWAHLGGQRVRVLYYGKLSPMIILPAEGPSEWSPRVKWFSLAMPSREPGDGLIVKTEGF